MDPVTWRCSGPFYRNLGPGTKTNESTGLCKMQGICSSYMPLIYMEISKKRIEVTSILLTSRLSTLPPS
jgi:hypothetical protein